jgi:hypothetical protein
MKLLLDECIDQRFATEIVGYEVRTVPEMGWANIKNGQLLTLAQAEFDAFITVDRNLPYQQNLPKYNIAVVVLRAKSNRLADLLPLVPILLGILPDAPIGEATLVGL